MDRSSLVADELPRIALLVVDGVSLLDIASATEPLAERGSYDVVVCSPDGEDVTTRSGLPFHVSSSVHDAGFVDTAVVLGGGPALDGNPTAAHASAVRHIAGRARRLAGVDSGTIVLSAAGLLRGRRVAARQEHVSLLRNLQPSTEVLLGTRVATDGNLITTAGEDAAKVLAATLVAQDQGEEHARALGAAAQDDERHDPRTVPATVNPMVRRLTQQIVADPTAPYSLADLAAKVAVSPRHLSRLFREALHTTPAKFVEQVRFDTARSLLDGGMSVTDSAFMSGFGSLEAQRRAFVSRLGVSPRVYQRRVRCSPPAEASRLLRPPCSSRDLAVPDMAVPDMAVPG
ncbi:GlxA family transcriptional regulator [Streptomyces olivaceoviridis]